MCKPRGCAPTPPACKAMACLTNVIRASLLLLWTLTYTLGHMSPSEWHMPSILVQRMLFASHVHSYPQPRGLLLYNSAQITTTLLGSYPLSSPLPARQPAVPYCIQVQVLQNEIHAVRYRGHSSAACCTCLGAA